MTLRTIQHGLQALLLSVMCGAPVAAALAQVPPEPAPESQQAKQAMDKLGEVLRKGQEEDARKNEAQGGAAPAPAANVPRPTTPATGAAPTSPAAPERKARPTPEEVRARAAAQHAKLVPPAVKPGNEVAPSDVPADFVGPPPHLVQVQATPAATPAVAAPGATAPDTAAPAATDMELTRPPMNEDENWFQFKDTPWEDVIRRFVERIGKPLMTPEGDLILGGNLTYETNRKFTKEEAIDELNLIMQEKGYRFVERPNHIYIVPLSEMRSKVDLDRTFNSLDAFLDASPRDMDYVMVYYQVKDQPAQFFVDVFTDALPDLWLTAMKESNQIKIVGVARDVRKFVALKDLVVLTPDDPRQLRIFKIKTNATDIEQRVRQLLNIGPSGPTAPTVTMVRDPRTGAMVPRAMPAAPGANASADAGTQMVADERTNSIIVKATSDKIKEIEGLIETLDIEPPLGKFRTEVIEVQHADATAVATLMQSILQQEQGQANANTPAWQNAMMQQRYAAMMAARGRGGNPNVPVPMPTPMTMGGGVSPESIIAEGAYERARKTIRLVADSRTNSLIVYANDEGFERVRGLLEIIDKPMPDSYKVFVLENGQVSDVAPLLTQLIQGLISAGDSRTGRAPSIITDESTNSLHVVADKVEMERIEKLIHQLDVTPPEQTRHVVELQNLRPSQVAQMVQTLLASGSGGSSSGAPSSPAMSRLNRMGRRGMVGPGMTTPTPTATVTGTSAREYQVIALDEAGVLIVMCSDDDWAKVEDTIQMWDEKARSTTPKLETFEVAEGNPQNIAALLGNMYRQYDHPVLGRSSVTVQADGNTLYVYGVQPAIDEIAALLPSLDVKSDADQIEVLALANADASQVAQQIQPYFAAGSGGGMGRGMPSGGRGPIINVEAVTNSLIVQAGKADMEKIKNLALLLDQNIAKVATEQKFFTMRYAQAQDVAAAVQNIFGGQRVGRGAASPIKAMAAGSQVVVEAPHERMQTIEAFITKMDDPQGKQMVTRVEKLAGADVQQIAQNLTAWFRSQPPRPDRLVATFIPDNTTESIIITAPADLEGQITELISKSVMGSVDLTLERRSYPIKNTEATYIADILKQQLLPQVEARQGKIVAQRINISLDDRQNQLVINAPRFVHPIAEGLIGELDREGPDQAPVTISLKYADAGQVVQTIQAMFRSTGGGRGQLQDVQITASGSQLIIKAPKKKLADIEALIAAMDSEDTAGGIQVKTYELKVLNASQVQSQVTLFLQQMKKNTRPGQLSPGAFAEPTTNTLVVLAPPEVLPIIDGIILELENKTPPTGRAHAYALRNARADQIANNIDGMLKVKVQEKEGAKKNTLQTAVFADPQGNRLFVYAPDEYQNLAAELIAMVDAEVDSGEIVHIISLTEADATQMAQTLGQVVQGKVSKGGAASVRISADAGSNALLLAGLPKDVAEVEKWITELEGNSVRVPELQTFTLKYANADDVEKWLKNAFPQAKNAQDAVVISSDVTSDKLIVFANRRKMREVEAYVAQLDADPSKEADVTRQIYFVDVYRGKASDIAWDMRDIQTRSEEKGGPTIESDWYGEYIRVTCRPSEFPAIEKQIREFDRRSKPEFTAKIVKLKASDQKRVLEFLKARSGEDVVIQETPTQTDQESLIEVLRPDGDEPPKSPSKHEPAKRTNGIAPFQVGTSLTAALLDEIEMEMDGTPVAAVPAVAPVAASLRQPAHLVRPAATGAPVMVLGTDQPAHVRLAVDEPKPTPAAKPPVPATKAVTAPAKRGAPAAPTASPAMPPKPKDIAPAPTKATSERSLDDADEETAGADLQKQPTEVIVQPDGTLLIKGQKRGVDEVSDTLDLLQGDLAAGEVIRIFQFRYGDVTAAAEILSMMYEVQRNQPVIIQQPQQQQRRQGQQGQGDDRDQGGIMSQFRNMVGGDSKSGKGGLGGGQLRMATDPGHNYLIVKCEETALPEIRKLLRELDIPPGEVQVKIFQLKNLVAGETAENIKDVLGISKAQSKRTGTRTPSAARQPGMPGGQQQQLMEMLQQQLVSVPGVEGGAKVERVEIVANDGTNSLLVSAPPEVMGLVERVITEMEELEGRDVVGVNYYPLEHARVDDILPLLEEVFGAAGGGSSSFSFPRGGRGGMGMMMSMGGAKSPAAMGSVSVSADPRSNTIIYICEKKDAETVAKHIRALDIEGTVADVETYVCEHGDAEAIASVIETIFVGGGRSSGMRNPFMGGGTSSSSADVRIAADNSTNSILVWGPPDKRDQIFQKIEELDKLGDRDIANIPVRKATASQVASFIMQFLDQGTQQTGGSRGNRSGRQGTTESKAPRIVPNDAAKELIVQGTKRQISEIKVLVDKFDNEELVRGRLKVFEVPIGQDAVVMAAEIERIINSAEEENARASGRDARKVVLGSDEKTNTIIAAADPTLFGDVESLIEQLTNVGGKTRRVYRVFQLQNVSSRDAADMINSLQSSPGSSRTSVRPSGTRRSGSGSSGSMSSPRPSGTRSGSGTRSTPRSNTPTRRTTPRPAGGGGPAPHDGGSSRNVDMESMAPVALGPSAWTQPCMTVMPVSPLMVLVAQVADQAQPPTTPPATGRPAPRRTPPAPAAPAPKPAAAEKAPVTPPSAPADEAPVQPSRGRRPVTEEKDTAAEPPAAPAPTGRPGLRMPGSAAPVEPASEPTGEPEGQVSGPATVLEGLTGVSGALRGEVTAEVIDSQQIMIIGDESDVDFVEQILRMMEGTKQRNEIEIFTLEKAKAVSLAPIIEKVIQSQIEAQGLDERYSINAEGGSNTLIVSASPAMLDRIAELVERFDMGATERDTAPTMVAVTNVRAADAVAILRPQLEKLYAIREIPKDAQPSIEAIDRSNSVLIIGTPSEAEEITKLIEAIDVEIPTSGDKSASFVRAEGMVLQLKNGLAEDVAKVITDMIKAEQEAGTATASSGSGGGSRAAGKAAVKLIKLHMPDGTELPELNLEYPIRLVPEKGTNSLIIFSTPNNNEALKAIVGVFDSLPIGADTDVKAFALKHASAEEVAKLLTELFKDKSYLWPPSKGETKGLTKGELPPVPPGMAAKGLPFPVVVQADTRSNTVLVIGRTDAVMLAAGLIGELDQSSTSLGMKSYVLQLKNVQAATTAEKLKKTMDDRSKALGADKNAARDNAVIAADERSNSLILLATPEMHELVEDLVLQLDASDKYSVVDVRYHNLQYADATKLQGLLQETFDNRQKAEQKANKDATDVLNVMADSRSNSLLMTGTRDYLADAEALIAKLDQAMEGSVVFRARKLKLNSAANVSALLQDIVDKALKQQDSKLKGTPIQVTADPVSDTLLLAAAREDMEILERWIDTLDRPSEIGRMIRIVPLARATAEDVAKSVQDVFKKSGSGGSSGSKGQIDLTVTADKATNSIIAYGPTTLLTDVEDFVRQLDNVESPKHAMVKTFKLVQADAQDAGDLIQRILDLQGGSVGGTGSRSSSGSSSKTDSAKAIMLILQKEHAELGLETLKAARSEITVISDLRTNSLVVTAPPESMALMEALVASVDVPPDAAKIRVFRLRNADPEQMVKTLEELFSQKTASSTSSRGTGSSTQGERILTLEGGMGEGGGRQEIAFTSDLRTNSVIAAGTPGYLDLVENMLLELDTIPIKARETMVYTPKSTTAKDLATALKEFSDAEQKRLQDIGDEVSTLVKQERQIGAIASEDANKLVLDYDPRFKDTVMRIVRDLDQQPPQVNIQVLIIEVTVDNALDLGMEFAFQDLQYAKAGPSDTTTFDYVGGTDIGAAGSGLGGFSFTITGADFNFLFRTLQNEGSLRVLSRPEIVAMDNKEASIDISNDVPYVNGTQTSSTGQIATSVARQKVGIKLKVTPQINPDGFVRMEVEQEVSDLTGSTVDVGPGVTSPIFFTRNAKTTITVMDSETVVLGGLITSRVENREQKVPLVGDIPGLGMIFRNQSDDTKRTELLLVLTPRVVRTPEEYHDMSIVERDRLQLIDKDALSDPLMQNLQIKGDGQEPATIPVRREAAPADENLAPTEEEYGPFQPAMHGALMPAEDPNSYDLPLATGRTMVR